MRYKTCASVAEKTPKRLKQTLTKALKKSDYAEIRFDFLNPNLVPDALQQIKKDLRKCVCTLRPVSEGGKFEGGEKNRISIIKLIAEYNPFLLDVELNTLSKNIHVTLSNLNIDTYIYSSTSISSCSPRRFIFFSMHDSSFIATLQLITLHL